MGNNLSTERLEQMVRESILSSKDKREMLEVINGEKLANIYRDAIAKRLFSPDVHPERLDFLLQRTMGDASINVEKSAANEGMQLSKYSKKVITDLPAWLFDHRRIDVEIQAVAQDFVFARTDIYSSNMLMIQLKLILAKFISTKSQLKSLKMRLKAKK